MDIYICAYKWIFSHNNYDFFIVKTGGQLEIKSLILCIQIIAYIYNIWLILYAFISSIQLQSGQQIYVYYHG